MTPRYDRLAMAQDAWKTLMLFLIVASLIIPGALDFWLPCGFVDNSCSF